MGAFSHGSFCPNYHLFTHLLAFSLLLTGIEFGSFNGAVWSREHCVNPLTGHLRSQSRVVGLAVLAEAWPITIPEEPPLSSEFKGATASSLDVVQQDGRVLAETFQFGSKIVLGAIVETSLTERYQAVMQMAVDHLNQNSSGLFGGAELELRVLRPERDQFEVAVAMLDLLQSTAIAVIGPLYSFSTLIASPLATAAAVPVISYSATDIALSDKSLHPFFLRTVQSDAVQMEALAKLVAFFNWTEIVMFHVNDAFGFGGVHSLESMLVGTKVRVAERVALDFAASENQILEALQQTRKVTETTVFLVHILPNMVMPFFRAVDDALMMKAGFTWLLSDSTLSALSFMTPRQADLFSSMTEGVVGMKLSLPKTAELERFYRDIVALSNSSDLLADTYAYHAYDAVQLIGLAISQGIRDGQLSPDELTGRGDPKLFGQTWSQVHQNRTQGVGGIPINALSSCTVRNVGPRLFNLTLSLGMKGTVAGAAGTIKLDENGDNVNMQYSFINIVGGKTITVGSWSQVDGLKLSSGYGGKASNVTSGDFPLISWPGRSQSAPLGWLPNSGRSLRVAVPINAFQPFVIYNKEVEGNAAFTGQVIEVFESAIKMLPFPLSYNYEPVNYSTYNAMCQSVAEGTYDMAVGDVSITDFRSKFVDFTQQFQSAGLVVIAPLYSSNSNLAWAFLQPYTWDMWLAMMGLFLFMALVIWWLERGKTGMLSYSTPPRKAFGRALWWSYTTLFFSHAPIVRTPLGRIVTAVWLFVVLIVVSSYQANLTSTLTVKQLQPTVTGIISLIQSKMVIGVLKTAWYSEALLTLGVPASRIFGLKQTFADHAEKLKLRGRRGGVDAIVDELPYSILFTQENCEYSIVGQEFYKGGWGWPFQKGSRLQPAISTAILQLSKDGSLYRIQQKWLSSLSQCARSGLSVEVNRLGLQALGPLFLILLSTATISCIIVLLLRAIDRWLHHRRETDEEDDASSVPNNSARNLSREDMEKDSLERGTSPHPLDQDAEKDGHGTRSKEEEERGGGSSHGSSHGGGGKDEEKRAGGRTTEEEGGRTHGVAAGERRGRAPHRGSWLRAAMRFDRQDSMGI